MKRPAYTSSKERSTDEKSGSFADLKFVLINYPDKFSLEMREYHTERSNLKVDSINPVTRVHTT